MEPDSESTQRLFEQARAGRREAYEALFELHRPELDREVKRRLRGRAARLDASDVVQEAFADAVRGFASFEPRGPGSFRGWLARIVENRLRMMLKAKRAAKRDVELETALSSGIAPDSATSPISAAARSERAEEVERALSRLSPAHREVLRLVRLRERSIADAACAMGRSENAVKKLLARALLELREEIEGGGHDAAP